MSECRAQKQETPMLLWLVFVMLALGGNCAPDKFDRIDHDRLTRIEAKLDSLTTAK